MAERQYRQDGALQPCRCAADPGRAGASASGAGSRPGRARARAAITLREQNESNQGENEMTTGGFIDRRSATLGLSALGASVAVPAVRAQGGVKKIVFWAGPKEHGAPGRHEY